MADKLDDQVFDKIQEVDLKKTMEESYIDYAMSVIAARALPDVRDGLKPVQRRVLYSMIELNNGPDKPHRKCARIVGDTMGKYHPHGDSSIYGALVNMAQDWNFRYTLVDGHGNFGSMDGDGAAAMRYTEARLSKISMEMLADIGKDTVEFVPNFDETEKEPTVLPARFPNLLVNGTTGIAVGMATNIPPHNLGEVIAAVVRIIDDKIEDRPETTIDEIMEIIKGPDFPTGAMIVGRAGIEQAYRTGRGKIRVRAVTEIEQLSGGRSRIVVTELPYLVNKARLIEKIADLVKEKKIEGITGITDESSREGLRVTIDVRHDANANVILNLLYKHTQLQDTFGATMLALVDNQPRIMNILEMLQYYLKHQEDVITRRTRYDLNKAQERAHILEGLLIALDHIDEVIRIIRASANTQEAKANLMQAFGLSDAQAQAIVDMRLRALTGLERHKLEEEYAQLKKLIQELTEILADEKLLLGVIKKELLEISDKYADERRTQIGMDELDLTTEDLIDRDDVVLAKTALGYIKRMTNDTFHSQNRGGKGIRGMQTVDNDYVTELMTTSTHDDVMFFTNKGRVFKMRAYRIPEASRTSRGTAIINLLQLQPEEKVTNMITLHVATEDSYLMMVTRKGVVKKTPMRAFSNVLSRGVIALRLNEDDELISVRVIHGGEQVMLVTRKGMAICFDESEVRSMGRTAAGVRGIRLSGSDEVCAMLLKSEGDYGLLMSEKGYGKRIRLDLFTPHHRGGKGIRCYQVQSRTGEVFGALSIYDGDEVMIINTEGILIRTYCDSVSIQGRTASGVRIMALAEGQQVAGMTKVYSEEDEEEGAASDDVTGDGTGEGERDESYNADGGFEDEPDDGGYDDEADSYGDDSDDLYDEDETNQDDGAYGDPDDDE